MNRTKIIFFTVCLFLLFTYCVIAQSNESEKAVLELETKAKSLSLLWEFDALNTSHNLFIEAANKWTALNNPPKQIKCLREASQVLIILGETKKAEDLFNDALKIAKKNKLIDEQVLVLSDLALMQFELGNKKKGNFFFVTAQNSIKRTANPTTQAHYYFVAGEFSYFNRDIENSIEQFKKSIQFATESNENFIKAGSLRYLGFAYLFNYNYDRALSSLQESLLIAETLGDKRKQSQALITTGYVLIELNKKQEALNSYLKAEKLFPNNLDFVEKARLFNGIGAIYEDYGDFEISFEYRKNALQFFQKANYPFGQVATIVNLGTLSHRLNKDEQALEYFQSVKNLAKSIGDEYFLAITEEELGHFYFEKQMFAEAQDYYKKSLDYFQKNNYIREIALIREKLGQIYLNQNQFDKARNEFNISKKQNIEIQNKLSQSQILFNLGVLDRIENKMDAALKNTFESINLTETLYSEVANSNLQRSYFSNVYDRYELYIHILMQKHKESPTQDFAIQALQASEKSRSRSLLETLRLSEANFTKDANPDLIDKEKELRKSLSLKTDKLTELLSNRAEKSETDKVEDEIRSLENELENIKAELKQNSPVYSAIKNPPPFDVTEFQKNILDDKTVLLEFALGERESYLWLVNKNEVLSYVLPPRGVIENRVDKIHQTFEKRQIHANETIEIYQQRTNDAEKEFNEETKLLSQDLLGQVIEKIQSKRLIVVPDGKLSLLPLSALPIPNSDEPIILHNEIIYEPSASLLNILANLQTQKHPPNKDLLVFADPVFSDIDNRVTTQPAKSEQILPTNLGLNLRDFRLTDENGRIPRLFATQEEADSIAEVVGKSRTVVASGFNANRERVINSDIADYRILHFATHGLVDVKRPEISSIVLSQLDENGNKREGFLRLQDIYALNLASDLIVLSACQSGVGKEVRGEGIMSLNNAFLQAGAKSVLSSAWKVDDKATAELMRHFYTNLSAGFPPPEALRQAQISLLKSGQFKSPFYWGAFTVQGEFLKPIVIGKSNFYYYFIPILICLGLIAFWGVRKRLKG